MATLGGTFALTLVAGMYAYLANMPLSAAELLFLLPVSYALVLTVRWLWARFKIARGGGPE
jgi:hypothetical protein